MSTQPRSELQRLASIANGAHSQGPVTAEGKATVARNAIKHGLRSTLLVLPTESLEEFDELKHYHMEMFQPSCELSMRLVREATEAEWRLRRVRRLMDQAFCDKLYELNAQHPELPPQALEVRAFDELHAKGSSYSHYLRYETKYERQFNRTVADLRAMAKDSARQPERTNKPEEPEPIDTPRNAPCPCGSGLKYKRCCGQHAPPHYHYNDITACNIARVNPTL